MANTVLITGASRGIGAATARYFGEQGWQVAVHYHEREDLALELVRELREMGTCAVALGADLAEARDRAYRGMARVRMDKARFRSDIGVKGLKRLRG